MNINTLSLVSIDKPFAARLIVDVGCEPMSKYGDGMTAYEIRLSALTV